MIPGTLEVDWLSITLQLVRIQRIITILELDDTSRRISHGIVICGVQVLERLWDNKWSVHRQNNLYGMNHLPSSIDEPYTLFQQS